MTKPHHLPLRLATLVLASAGLARIAHAYGPAPLPAVAPPAHAAAAAPSPAAAAPPPTAPEKLAEARVHFQQGVALYREQNYDAALAEFLGAYAISSEPVVNYNIGLTCKALFRYAEAVDRLERYLSESAARGSAVPKDRRGEVEAIIAEMKALLADVTVDLQPASATLHIDGRPITLGIEGIVKLPAGSHTVEASAPDHVSDRRELLVVAGVAQSIALHLSAIPHTGNVTINASQIGARVVVDGRDLGQAPVSIELAAGGHQVEVSAPGFATSRNELTVAAGQARTVTVTLEAPPSPAIEGQPFYHRWWFWTGVAAVAAGTAAAIVFWPARTQDPLVGTLGVPANTSTGVSP